jgi:hypothetical protein
MKVQLKSPIYGVARQGNGLGLLAVDWYIQFVDWYIQFVDSEHSSQRLGLLIR